ncbi:hypothetical protein [Chitinophaga sp. OAE865]|uniref:hypothetical protein n=1 Tax=Chitinophaga sp. OAE865 TaxID=2817898 RepID=UPI001AE1E96F
MKLARWASLPGKENIPFSMRSIKTWFYNKHLTETIFSNLELELNILSPAAFSATFITITACPGAPPSGLSLCMDTSGFRRISPIYTP